MKKKKDKNDVPVQK